jgi:hypothetical protein
VTTDPEDTPGDGDNEAPREPELSGSEQAFVRLTFWQTVLSLAGVFIAIVALYAALTESEATRKQTAAISLTNAGVGPARMRSMRVLFGGEPLRDWHHAMALIGEQGTHRLGQSYVNRRVLIPAETIDMVSTKDRVLVEKFLETLAGPDNAIA